MLRLKLVVILWLRPSVLRCQAADRALGQLQHGRDPSAALCSLPLGHHPRTLRLELLTLKSFLVYGQVIMMVVRDVGARGSTLSDIIYPCVGVIVRFT